MHQVPFTAEPAAIALLRSRFSSNTRIPLTARAIAHLRLRNNDRATGRERLAGRVWQLGRTEGVREVNDCRGRSQRNLPRAFPATAATRKGLGVILKSGGVRWGTCHQCGSRHWLFASAFLWRHTYVQSENAWVVGFIALLMALGGIPPASAGLAT